MLLALTGLAVGLYVIPPIARAQAPAPPPPSTPEPKPAPDDAYELRPIQRIVLREPVEGKPTEFAPASPAIEQLVRNQLRTLEGRPFRRAIVTEDVSRLNRLGRFRSIESDVQLAPDGSVIVTFTLREQAVMQDVQVVGNTKLADQELLKATALVPGAPLDRFQLDRAARAMEDLYRTKGYYNVSVAVDEKELADSSIAVFRVGEGQRVRVMGITFEGNNSFTAKELDSAVKTSVYVPIFDKGPLDDELLRQDVASLARFYRERGYLDVRVGTRVQPSPNGREALVAFRIDEGPLYTLRSVEVYYNDPEALEEYRAKIAKDPKAPISYLSADQMHEIGRRSFSAPQIVGLMSIKPGDVYSENKLRASVKNIEDSYGKLGYILDLPPFETTTARISQREVRDENRPEVTLILFIHEGKPTTLGQIVTGRNEITQQKVVLRQIDLKPDRPVDDSALEESQRRLDGLRLFVPNAIRVKVLPEDPRRPGVRDVYMETPETNTGEFNIGAAIGSDAGVVGTISLVQRNFDVFDTPDSFEELISGRAFRGAGQRFEAIAQPGTKVQDFRLGLTEPYFMESDYSVGGQALYRRREYNQYTEERFGGNVSLGRRFGTVWEGGLTLRNEWVRLGDFGDDAPKDYFDAQERRRVTGLGFSLARTTTNDKFRPSKGSRLDLSVERVGLPGDDSQFTKLHSDYTLFLNVHESFLGYKTILKLHNEIAIIPEGQSEVPVYERYSMGGRSFRGFGTQGVSPVGLRRDGTVSDDPVGGSFLFFLGGEIQQPVYQDIVSIVGFIDTGTVDSSVSLARYRVSVGTGVRIGIPQLSPIPLAFDFGFPILKQSTDRERLFTFSIDIPF